MRRVTDAEAQRLDETFLGPRNVANYDADEVAALSGVERGTAEDVIRAAGGDPGKRSPRRQEGLDARLERGDILRGDVPDLRDEEVLTTVPPRADPEAVPAARERVVGFTLDEMPLLIGDGETTGPSAAEENRQTSETRDPPGREVFAGGDTPFFDPVVKAGRTVDLVGDAGSDNGQSSLGRFF